MRLKILVSIFILVLSIQCTQKKVTAAASARIPAQNLTSTNPGVVVIEDPSIYSRVVVISDVHGMFKPLVALLQAGQIIDAAHNWSGGSSALVIVGDSIDKGPQSVDVLNLWMQLQQQAPAGGGIVIHTLGNHEAEFLANPQNAKASELNAELTRLGISLTDLTTDTKPMGKFILNEPVALRMGKWIFAHAGLYPDMPWLDFVRKSQEVLSARHYQDDFLSGDNSILEAKKWERDATLFANQFTRLHAMNFYGIVFGHQPEAFGVKGRIAVKAQGQIIKIDNGMAPDAGSHPGSLLIFTKPAQMNALSFPEVRALLPDASTQVLSPE